MVDILSLLFYGSGAAVTSFASADMLLLDRHKKRIQDRAAELWNWLDDQRERKYLAYLCKFRWQRFFVMLYATIALIVVLLFGYLIFSAAPHGTGRADIPQYFEYHLVGMYVGSFVAASFMVRPLPRVLNWVAKTDGSWAYLWRSTLALLATFAATLASLISGYVVAEAVGVQSDPSLNFSSSISAFLEGLFPSIMTTVFALASMSWVLVVLPVIFVLLLTNLFRVAKFIAVRVAENSKGPQFILGALLGAAGFVAGQLKQLMAAWWASQSFATALLGT